MIKKCICIDLVEYWNIVEYLYMVFFGKVLVELEKLDIVDLFIGEYLNYYIFFIFLN